MSEANTTNTYNITKTIDGVVHIIGMINLKPKYILLKGHQFIDGQTTYNLHNIEEIQDLPQVNIFTSENHSVSSSAPVEVVEINDKSTKKVENLGEKEEEEDSSEDSSTAGDSLLEISSTHRFCPRLTTKDSFDLAENNLKMARTVVLDPTKITKDDLAYLKQFVEDNEGQDTLEDQSEYTFGTYNKYIHPLDYKV
jgi:hypothetical protein